MLRTPVLVGLRATPLAPRALRVATLELSHLQLYSRRPFSSHSKLCAEEQQKHTFQPHPADTIPRDLPPTTATPAVRRNARAHEDWVLHHPVYTPEEVNSIRIVRQQRKTVTDKVASALVAFARWGFDVVTRYKHASPEEALAALKKDRKEGLSLAELRKQGYVMSEEQWMARILFLESIAGVPGMVAGMLRHLKSLRLMKRDGGWIHTLLEEAENERMHLLTFMKIRNPSKAFRLLVIATQGVFFNMFFLAYLISPRAAHRFVAYLEEEACVTYTQIADEIKRGNIPEWAPGATPVPQIAKDYWRLDDKATMLDLILAVRADEASHRFVNHTLANLDGDVDWNPIGFKHPDAKMQGTMPGFTKEESIDWMKKVAEEMEQGKEEVKKIES